MNKTKAKPFSEDCSDIFKAAMLSLTDFVECSFCHTLIPINTYRIHVMGKTKCPVCHTRPKEEEKEE